MKRERLTTISSLNLRLPISALAACTMLAVTFGCVSKAPSVDVAPGSQRNPNASGFNPGGNGGSGFDQSLDTGSLTAVLDERILKAQFNVNTANLNYKFSYLGKSDSGAIRFSGGTSRLSLSKLKPGQAGTVTLEIYEATTLKLKGEQTNVALKPGQNELSLTLRLVNTTNPGTGPGTNPGTGPGTNNIGNTPTPQDTSLSIDVTLEGNTQPNTQPNIQPNTQPQTWSGVGDRGNENWNIESID